MRETPIQAALTRLAKTRHLLSGLILSSESFDYRKAKDALIELQEMIRELAREEARLRAQCAEGPQVGAEILPFPGKQLRSPG